MSNKISFIYFDVGGVLLKDYSDTDKWQEMYQDLGLNLEDLPKVDKIYSANSRKFNTSLPIDDLVPLVRKKLSLTIPAGYSMLQDFVDRFERNETLWPLLKTLKKTYRLGLLTNMYPKMLDTIKEAKLMPKLKWDVVIDSSVEGVQKPDSVIFSIATKWAGVPPEEILFIDNTEKHLVAPKKLGWQTFHYDSADYAKSTKELEKFLS